eukprot:UN00584
MKHQELYIYITQQIQNIIIGTIIILLLFDIQNNNLKSTHISSRSHTPYCGPSKSKKDKHIHNIMIFVLYSIRYILLLLFSPP